VEKTFKYDKGTSKAALKGIRGGRSQQ